MSGENLTRPEDDSISLKPFVEALWRSRQRVLIYWSVVAFAFLVGATVYYLTRPADRTASVEFRLVFDGADRGEYPNGTLFSRSDIIAPTVITKVFQQNELDRYLPFETFKNGLFIFESSRELDMLNYEYQAKLSDSRLPAVERTRIEAEFRQRLEALRVPQMSLQFMVSSTIEVPPSHVMEKVLNDVLATWAEQAATQRGALGYQVELLTPNVILKDTLNTQTTLIRYDLLRRHVARVFEQVERLNDLPGSTTVRVGSDNLTLLDLKTNLEDLLQFQLNPLIMRRLVYALSPAEVALNIAYLEDRVQELERMKSAGESRKQQLEAALQGFAPNAATSNIDARPVSQDPASSVPMSDSFLDRLIDLAGQSGALDFRKELTRDIIDVGGRIVEADREIAFYRETLRLLQAAARGGRPLALRPEDVTSAFADVQSRVIEILELTNEAYTTVSTSNLNPRSGLYRLVGPYTVQTLKPVTLHYLATVGLVFLGVVGLAIAAVVAGLSLLRLRRDSMQAA